MKTRKAISKIKRGIQIINDHPKWSEKQFNAVIEFLRATAVRSSGIRPDGIIATQNDLVNALGRICKNAKLSEPMTGQQLNAIATVLYAMQGNGNQVKQTISKVAITQLRRIAEATDHSNIGDTQTLTSIADGCVPTMTSFFLEDNSEMMMTDYQRILEREKKKNNHTKSVNQ